MRYAGAESERNTLRMAAQRRGFQVHQQMCRRKHHCTVECHGVHFAVAGHGLRVNNLSERGLRELLEDYPCHS